jgi:osmotically-inducible protein OsmY
MTIRRTDSDIKQDILTELKWDPEVSETEIGVVVKDGAASLKGNVPAYSHKYAAVRAVKRIRGVRAVADEIEVKTPVQLEGSDEDIAHRIARLFEWNVQIPGDSLKAEVRKGVVTLTGEVDWRYQRGYAEMQVRDIKGVKSIMNNINIRKRAILPDIKNEIMKALHRHASIEAGRVKVSESNGTVTLSGTVGNYFEKDMIEDAVWAAQGVTKVIDKLEVPETFQQAA